MTPFKALCVTLRCPSLRSAAVEPLLHAIRKVGLWLCLLGGLLAVTAVLTSLLALMPHAVGRAVELLGSPPPAERVFYAAPVSLASADQWATAEKALDLNLGQSPDQLFSARALLVKSKGFSLVGLSASERQTILLAIRAWSAEAQAQDQASAQRAAALINNSAASGVSAQALLAASALLASAPERLAIESVERAILNARAIDALSIPYWERLLIPDFSPKMAPFSERAIAEWQAVSSRSFMVSLKGFLAMAASLVLLGLAGLAVWACRRMAQNPSQDLLNAWEQQSLQDATGRPRANSKPRRL